MHRAAFRQRYAAWSLDATCIAAVATAGAWPWLAPAATGFGAAFGDLLERTADLLFTQLVAGATLPAIAGHAIRDAGVLHAAGAVQAALLQLAVPFLLAFMVVSFAWHVGWTASPWQATPGKRGFGLRVATCAGGRVSPPRAAARHLAAALSWATLNAGHLMALGPARRALHDRVARTCVVARSAAPGMRVAAWLWLQLVVTVVAVLAAQDWAAGRVGAAAG